VPRRAGLDALALLLQGCAIDWVLFGAETGTDLLWTATEEAGKRPAKASEPICTEPKVISLKDGSQTVVQWPAADQSKCSRSDH